MSADAVKKFFAEDLPARLNDPAKYEGINSTYQFNIENAGHWFVTVEDNKPVVIGEGHHDNSHVVIDADADTWTAILNKELNPQMAFMQQQLRIDGNMGLAMKLQTFLED